MRLLSKLLVFGVAVSACAGATALPASATTRDEGDASSISGRAPTQPNIWYTAGGYLSVRENITLGKGETSTTGSVSNFDLFNDPDGHPAGMTMTWPNTMPGRSAAAAYPLTLDGVKTDFWVKASINVPPAVPSLAKGGCEIFAGRPGTEGAEEPTGESPFECVTTRHGWDNDFDFSIGLAGVAEASGTITAAKVALTGGTFRTDSSFFRDGAAELAVEESTRFDTILRDFDHPFYENQARMEWAYEIVDGNKATGVWVAGLSTNYRGWSKFSADGRCAIYTSNPLSNGNRLDDAQPTENSAYTCSAKGEFVHGHGDHGDRHFDAAFAVGRR